MRLRHFACILLLWCVHAPASSGVILLATGDSQSHTTSPGDNSGWQYEGKFGGFLGTPIAPLYFITAKHIGGDIGLPLIYHGEEFITTAVFPDPNSDLQIWQVKADHPFITYAPVYRGGAEKGLELRVHGRGTPRGSEMTLDGALRGWVWANYDGVPRWGSNLVTDTPSYDGVSYLQASFDSPGVNRDEAHLSFGDSGGGIFVLENGLWSLAAINYGVDDLYATADNGTYFVAAIFDARGYYTKDENGQFVEITGDQAVPTSFYGTRTSARLGWIASVTHTDLSALPPQSYTNWLTAYYTPDQRADNTVTGPLADPDGDGINNLQEFAFNLDPTVAEPASIVANTGLRGLPLARLEPVSGTESRLTVEFVRRTAVSGAGLTYEVQFTPSLDPAVANWQPVGTEIVTPINARWERVKVTDAVAADAGVPARFVRVAVTQ